MLNSPVAAPRGWLIRLSRLSCLSCLFCRSCLSCLLRPARLVVLLGLSTLGAHTLAAPAEGGRVITDVRLHGTGSAAQAHMPITFGQVFAVGDLKGGETLVGRLDDGASVPLQVDVKATHADGSVRHAVLTAILPSVVPGARLKLALLARPAAGGAVAGPAAGSASAAAALSAATAKVTAPTPAALLASGFTSELDVSIDGKHYRASADEALKARHPTRWLAGPLVNEWLLAVPLVAEDGTEHPHLAARFAIRAFGDPIRVRVDVTVENTWAYEPGPKNLVYDVNLLVDGKSAYAKTGLTHYRQARWRRIAWAGAAPQVDIRHNTAYLIASRAVPNYDQRIVIAEATLAAWKTGWTGPMSEPMGIGLATSYMPTTGGRQDIGLLPGWAVAYLLSMDPRAREVTLGTADLAGSWSIHYRDRRTGRPISLVDYPYMTLLGRPGDTFNPVTKKHESFPDCGGDCKSPYDADAPHQPGFAYLPYLLTGDFYYLEELQFWASYDLLQTNPGYRDNVKGLITPEQIRGQAWDLRTLAEVAYITPDADPQKPQFKRFLDNNLDWFNATYTNDPKANRLGIIVNGFAIEYDQNTGIGPWQDDFFTQAIGHAAELGFPKAKPLLAWKSGFPIGRMIDPGFCWVLGSAYSMKVRDSATAPFYESFNQVYRASAPPGVADLVCGSAEMAAALKLKPGEMVGYSQSETGFPSNMQPALAYAADIGGARGAKAWKVFDARQVKPVYSSQPQFAIVPR